MSSFPSLSTIPGLSSWMGSSMLTTALAESSGAAPEHIQVVVQGVSPKHWGIAGKPGA